MTVKKSDILLKAKEYLWDGESARTDDDFVHMCFCVSRAAGELEVESLLSALRFLIKPHYVYEGHLRDSMSKENYCGMSVKDIQDSRRAFLDGMINYYKSQGE